MPNEYSAGTSAAYIRYLRSSVGPVWSDGKSSFSASREFLDFENWTIIKVDMAKNVTESTIYSQIF